MAVALAALVVFSVVLARLTLTPSTASADIAGANLQPGRSLRQYAEEYTFLAACKQVGGNLLLGAPFGLLLPLLVPRKLRMLRVLVLTAVVMIFVELTQGALVEGRAFDVDDVILNTSGALIAYLLLGRRISHRFHTLAEPTPSRGAMDPGGTEPGRETDDRQGEPAAPAPSLSKPAPQSKTAAPGAGRTKALTRLRLRFRDGFSSDRPRVPRRP
ncbi:VanZ family protein [Streptomyces sp. NPDC059076]|uniref:VanZ family protein n=1 Tax=unclassified Streptomyces TaxID=2593676 RepID=UPI0036C444CE